MPLPIISRGEAVALFAESEDHPDKTAVFAAVQTRVDSSLIRLATAKFVKSMALVVFLRGVNVGGHRTLRPSIVARGLSDYDVVNFGGAGTLIVRKPGSRAEFRAALLRQVPVQTEVVLCDSRDLVRLELENPFETEPSRPSMVRFVSILSRPARIPVEIPFRLPPRGEWFVRVIGSKRRFIFGVYRRHMRTISYLGQIDKLFGAPATTRNWNTILAVVRILKGQERNNGGA